MSTTLTLAAGELTESAPREVSGLLVPFGQPGYSGMGVVRFGEGTITLPTDIGRVKLLQQHDVERPLGYATSATETPEGLRVTFAVAEGPAGDAALAELAQGQRDGLSAGVRLSDDSHARIIEQWLSGATEPVDVDGELLEGSLVTIPAFSDARADGSPAYVLAAAAADQTLAVLSWGREPRTTQIEESTVAETVAPVVEAPAPVTPAPAVVPAVAPGAVVVAEAPVYTFNGRGPSLVRDIYNARFGYDSEAAGRVAEFNAALTAEDPNAHGVLRAAVETRATEPGFISSPTYRPELLLAAIDKGRPLISRLTTVNLTDATPFRLPIEPDFVAVGAHTEGTAHRAEGDLNTVGNVTVTPSAVSGAYRLSRELIDASNPAIDTIALNAMLRDYRRATEAVAIASIVSGGGAVAVSVNTVAKLRLALNGFQDRDDIPADFVLASTGFYGTLITEVDTTGRPMLPFVGPTNASGTVAAGYTGATIDGVEIAKASTVTANQAFVLRTDSVLYGESAVQTFRFEEVEGPGIIKLALFGYVAAQVIRPNGVLRVTTAAA